MPHPDYPDWPTPRGSPIGRRQDVVKQDLQVGRMPNPAVSREASRISREGSIMTDPPSPFQYVVDQVALKQQDLSADLVAVIEERFVQQQRVLQKIVDGLLHAAAANQSGDNFKTAGEQYGGSNFDLKAVPNGEFQAETAAWNNEDANLDGPVKKVKTSPFVMFRPSLMPVDDPSALLGDDAMVKATSTMPTSFVKSDVNHRKGLAVSADGLPPQLSAAIASCSSKTLSSILLPMPAESIMTSIVQGKPLECVSLLVVLSNAGFMAAAADFAVKNLGEEQPHSITTSEFVFTGYYVAELLLRLFVQRLSFFFNADKRWNWFDMALVTLALFELHSTLSGNEGEEPPLDPSVARLVRLLKMLKLLRMIKVMRSFRELRLIIQSIMESFRPMFWACVVILMITFVWSVAFVNAASTHMLDRQAELSKADQDLIIKYWGSMWNAMLSLFMSVTSGDSWGTISQPLKVIPGPYYAFFLLYVAFFTFVFANTLTSIFVEKSMEQSDRDHSQILKHEMEKKAQYVAQVEELFDAFDRDESGDITLNEFCDCMKDPKMVAFMSSIDVPADDVASFFKVLSDGGTHAVDVEQFVTGCMRLRGTAKSLDLASLIYATGRHQRESSKLLKQCVHDLKVVQLRLPA